MAKYSLVGVESNALSIIAYTRNALRKEGLSSLAEKVCDEATRGTYYELIAVCDNYVGIANRKAEENGYEDTDWTEQE